MPTSKEVKSELSPRECYQKLIVMKIKTTNITQLLFYLLLMEFVLFIVKLNEKPVISFEIVKWLLIITGLLFLSSIAWFLFRE